MQQANSSIKHYIFLHMASRHTTSKNHPALSFEGYSYRFDKLNASNTKMRWRCRTRDCNGSLYTNNNQDNADIVELSTSHKYHCISIFAVLWVRQKKWSLNYDFAQMSSLKRVSLKCISLKWGKI